MPSLVLGHLLLDNRVVTLIPFIDDKVLFVGDLVAGSERCRCFCNAECLSITFDGFGPGGDPCIACGNIDGTYTLERRGTDNASGPWVYSYCGDSACLVEGDPGCLEIILTLSCSQHTLSVLFCGSEILSATASNDGTKCDELTFTGAEGATCNPIGTITTGSAECGASSEQRCCDCPPCGTPQEWAIVDITSGFTILRSGGMAFSNTTIFDIPPAWPTRSWNTAPMPAVLRFGLFVRGTYETNCLQCDSWFALETWTVVPRKCSGGDWYSDHTFAESYANTSCDSDDPLSVLVGPLINQSNYNNIDFAGTVDCEWTNMKNWESTSGPTPLPWTIALPSEVTPIIVSGALLGDATGAAECKTLTITSTGTLGIHITVAETATINGTVARGCSTPCDPGCCEPQSMGWVEAVENVSLGGVNNGKISSDGTVEVGTAAQGGIVLEGQNVGGLIEASEIVFTGGGSNSGFLSASTIDFYDNSTNSDPVPWTECDWVVHQTPHIQGQVTFHDDSVNNASSFANGPITFRDDSSNAAGAKVTVDCVFLDSSVNYGEVGGNATFNGDSVNQGTVTGNATFNGNSSNLGTVLGTITCNTTGTCET